MSVSSYDAVAEKVLLDLELTVQKHSNLNEFYIIPKSEEDNKNSSPIMKQENTLGLESWIVSHIYPYAHQQILEKSNYKNQNLSKVIPCLTGVALLNPDMPTVWNKRRELIISKKLQPDHELRLTEMSLSRKPKCNDALTHRRWIVIEILKDAYDKSSLLREELRLSEIIANRYHSNYHAWSHRMWSLQHLLPESSFYNPKRRSHRNCLFDTVTIELSQLMNRIITKNEDSYLKISEISRIYYQELENNFKWISSHVSDHSGLHFRKFLITEIFSYVKNFLSHGTISGPQEIQNDFDIFFSNAQNYLTTSIIFNGKINIKDYLASFDFDNQYKRAINEFLANLEQGLTLFNIFMCLVVTELKTNHSLCVTFSHHEALWCYRRFLIFIYKQLIDALDFSKNNWQQNMFVHQDSNGVPYKKDFKFTDTRDSTTIPNHSDLYIAFYMRLISNEEEIMSKMNTSDPYVKSLLRNYSHWFRNCFKGNEL